MGIATIDGKDVSLSIKNSKEGFEIEMQIDPESISNSSYLTTCNNILELLFLQLSLKQVHP